MTTVYLDLRVATSDVQKATDAVQGVGFYVRTTEDFSPGPDHTDLSLSIQYLSDDPNDVEPQLLAQQLRDESLKKAGVQWEHLSGGVSSGPTLSTFTIRPKGQPDHTGQKVVAANWDQFNELCEQFYNFVPSVEEYDIEVEGIAANDERPG